MQFIDDPLDNAQTVSNLSESDKGAESSQEEDDSSLPSTFSTSNICENKPWLQISQQLLRTFTSNKNEILKIQNQKQKDRKTKISSKHIEVMKAIEGINLTLKQVLENQNKLINLWEASLKLCLKPFMKSVNYTLLY